MSTLETPTIPPAEEIIEPFETPILLEQLQDDLTRSRRREALWMSLFFHAFVLVLILLSPKWTAWVESLFPTRAAVVVSPQEMMDQKDLTYLALPPDEQKLTKAPKTDVMSDKDRIATSRAPRVDREELKKILDAARAGAPGTPGMRVPPAPPAQMAQNSPQRGPQQKPDQSQSPAFQSQMAAAKPAPNPFAAAAQMSAGSIIQQAARSAAMNRGGGGIGGEFGLGRNSPSKVRSDIDILSDTMGVDFGPYLSRIVEDIRQHWYNVMPESVYPPLLKKGKLTIEFAIMKDGSIAGMRRVDSSGDIALDRAAWGGISGANPFPPLPSEFHGNYLALRIRFGYNISEKDLQ
jgi:TonB family protein